MRHTKQVILMRADLKMRKGKIAAQAGHASMAFLTKQLEGDNTNLVITDEDREWLNNSFTKICLQVNSEEELDEFYFKALDAGLMVHLVTDNGRTEFGGIPTKTCLAIGPHYSEKIDEITSELKLY